MGSSERKYKFKDTDIAIALLQGGLDWIATVAVMKAIKFEKDSFDGTEVINS
jgi:hypothetical protein